MTPALAGLVAALNLCPNAPVHAHDVVVVGAGTSGITAAIQAARHPGTSVALVEEGDLIGGQIEAMFLPIHVALSQVRSGRLVALGIGSDKRHPLLPDVPTLTEARAGEVNVDMWYGIFAPKGMPAAQVAALNREINDILRSDEVKKAFEGQGMDPATDTPEAFGRLVAQDADRWAALIKAQSIKAE